MKKCFLLILISILCANLYARQRIIFTISKPLCILTFLQASNGTGAVAPSLTEFIQKSIPLTDSGFYKAALEFSQLDLQNSYTFSSYPEKRQRPKTVMNTITIAAVHSATVDEMMERIIGVLPNEQWLKLRDIMRQATPYYDKLIATPYNTDIQHRLTVLQSYNVKTDSIFNKLKHFYNSSWAGSIPFIISIYPVPGRRGSTSATPHSNCLVLAMLTQQHDDNMLTGIAMHEICHVLYDEQPLTLQWNIDSCFLNNHSIYSAYAYDYIDEALATACGNGWAYKELAGHKDHTAWYDNDYINKYAHAIYPMVCEYIENNKQIDSAFVEKAITIFEEKFPEAPYDYQNLMNRISLYTDADDNTQYNTVLSTVNKYFKVTGCWGAYPISDPQTLDMISRAKNTQVFVVYTDNDKNFTLLKAKFPQLKDVKAGETGIITFMDDRKRPVIIINVKGIDMVERGVKMLAQHKKMDTTQRFIPMP